MKKYSRSGQKFRNYLVKLYSDLLLKIVCLQRFAALRSWGFVSPKLSIKHRKSKVQNKL